VTVQNRITEERLAAQHRWDIFLRSSELIASLGTWQEVRTELGPLLSVQVTGPQAARAVTSLTDSGHLCPTVPPFRRPQLDYSVPGRVACVWQSSGVWVEFWHPDTVTAAPPAPKPSALAGTRKPTRPSGRLFFTRRKPTKETTTA
jgi:hypothetical protein